MGIYFHELCFLRYLRRHGAFGAVATLGRQQLHLHTGQIRALLDIDVDTYYFGQYCEELLVGEFGAGAVESFDVSDYEGATHIRDFNLPVEHDRRYDTLIDLGSSEHVFDVAQSLRNVAGLCAVGGQVIHVLPADNMNGHGFWQFSPEVFFSLYSEANGFAETELFFAEVRNFRFWYRVRQAPSDGRRIEIGSRSPTYLLVRARKTADRIAPGLAGPVQQSDYLHAWETRPRLPPRASPPRPVEPPAPRRRGLSLAKMAKAALSVSPGLYRRARRIHSEVNTALLHLRTRRTPDTQPELFEEVEIARIMRGGAPPGAGAPRGG